MAGNDGFYKTGEVASLLGVSTNTAVRWFDSGKLDGHVLPSGDRRYSRASLVKFMEDRNMDTTVLERGVDAKEDFDLKEKIKMIRILAKRGRDGAGKSTAILRRVLSEWLASCSSDEVVAVAELCLEINGGDGK